MRAGLPPTVTGGRDNSGLSVEIPAHLPIINSTAPSKPPNISQIYYTSSTSIRVHWEPIPQQYVHGRLLGYQVEYCRVEPGCLNTWKTITVGANDHAATITGLKKHGAYVFQVGAFTRKGRGTLSKASKIRTDEDGSYLNCLPISVGFWLLLLKCLSFSFLFLFFNHQVFLLRIVCLSIF